MATALHFAADSLVCPACGSPVVPDQTYCRACLAAADTAISVRGAQIGSVLLLSNLRVARPAPPSPTHSEE